jgi:hypothetical protein
MTSRALTPDERKAWARMRRKGYRVEMGWIHWAWLAPNSKIPFILSWKSMTEWSTSPRSTENGAETLHIL